MYTLLRSAGCDVTTLPPKSTGPVNNPAATMSPFRGSTARFAPWTFSVRCHATAPSARSCTIAIVLLYGMPAHNGGRGAPRRSDALGIGRSEVDDAAVQRRERQA